MKVEFMIYIYGAVCASMIVFNIVYNLLLKGSKSRMQKRCPEDLAQNRCPDFPSGGREKSGGIPSGGAAA